MAVFALTNMYTALNGTDRSTTIRSSTLSLEVNTLNTETFGDTWEEFIAGLKKGSLELEFVDDVAASAIDSILFPLFGTVVPFEVRADGGTVTTSNPKYTGSVLINSHMLGGAIGELAQKKVSYPTSGTVTRATS